MLSSRPRMVLMIPLRRCGSNALRLRLNLNPHFYSPYPLHVTDLLSRKNYGNLANDDEYLRLITDVVALQKLSLIPWSNMIFDPTTILQSLQSEKERSIHRVIGELILLAGEARGASVVMDKSQDSVVHFEEIMAAFPDMLFLDMVRDPRAQICSMNKSILYDFHTLLNLNRWIEARQWADRVRAKHPDRILTFRYEDLITNQEITLRTICNFLAIPFCKEMLDVGASREAQQMASLSPLWETNFSAPNPYHISKFKDSLTTSEINYIEQMTSSWMDALGYSRLHMTLPLSVMMTTTIEEAKEESEKKKKEAWAMLAQKHPIDYAARIARSRYLSSC